VAKYVCKKQTATAGPTGKLYQPGDTEDFRQNPGKHWERVGEVIAAPKLEAPQEEKPDVPKRRGRRRKQP
jgi:hypothetical protein